MALLIFIGLSVGSFLNVVIYRLPVMLNRQWEGQAREILNEPEQSTEPFNLMVPRSRCPSCGATIGALENVPVLSWIALRGRWRHCKAGISAR